MFHLNDSKKDQNTSLSVTVNFTGNAAIAVLLLLSGVSSGTMASVILAGRAPIAVTTRQPALPQQNPVCIAELS